MDESVTAVAQFATCSATMSLTIPDLPAIVLARCPVRIAGESCRPYIRTQSGLVSQISKSRLRSSSTEPHTASTQETVALLITHTV